MVPLVLQVHPDPPWSTFSVKFQKVWIRIDWSGPGGSRGPQRPLMDQEPSGAPCTTLRHFPDTPRLSSSLPSPSLSPGLGVAPAGQSIVGGGRPPTCPPVAPALCFRGWIRMLAFHLAHQGSNRLCQLGYVAFLPFSGFFIGF